MAAASMSSSVLAGWEPAQRHPDPAVEVLYEVPPSPHLRRVLGDRRPLARGAGLVWRYADAAVQRRPEQPDHEVGRGHRAVQRLSQTLELHQWKHPRPAGPTPHL